MTIKLWDACTPDYGCGVFRNIPFAAKQLQVAWKLELKGIMALLATNKTRGYGLHYG